jgi:hypothetical protein
MKNTGERLSLRAGGILRFVSPALLLLLPVLTVDCSRDLKSPVSPKWDVDLTVPIADRVLTLGEMIERDTSLIHEGAGNQLVFSQTATAPRAYVGDQISLTPSYGAAQLHLGTFSVTVDPVLADVRVPGLTPGATMPVPPSSFALPDIPTAMPSGSSIKCACGTIGLTIRNNLPVAIIGTSPVKLVDSQGTIQAFFDFTNITIPPGGGHTVYDSLASRTLGDGASLNGFGFSTPGSSNPVTIPADSMLVAAMFVTNLQVSEAQLNSLPAQRLTDNDRANIDIVDSTIIQNVHAKSGRLSIEFRNRINLGVVMKFRLSDLWHPVGGRLVQFEDSVALAAAGEASYDLNLAGCTIASPTGGLVNSLEVVSSVIIPNDITTPVGLHDTDKVDISMATLAPIIIDSAAAVLKPTWIDLNTVVPLNLGQMAEKFKWQLLIPSASLVLNTQSTVASPMDLYLTLSARKDAAGNLAVLQIPASQRRLTTGQGIITFDETEVGQFLSQITGGLPDSIRISGKVLVNPADAYYPGLAGVRSIGSNCSFGGTVNLNVPLKVGFGGSTYCDTLGVGNGDQRRSGGEMEGVNNGRVLMELDNALPMQVGVKLRLLDFAEQPMLMIPQSGQPVEVTSALVDAQGNVTVPAHSSVLFELNHNEAQLVSPADFVEYTFDLSTSLGSPAVWFKTTDYIHVRCWSEISYGVNK